MSTRLNELRAMLESLPFHELKTKAKQHYGVTLYRDDKKEDIINKILGVASKAEYAKMAVGDGPDPGWARIKLHPVPGIPDWPRYFDHNGYFGFLPVNVEVDVPIKIIAEDGVLRCSGEWKPEKNEYDETVTRFVESIPFTVLQISPGPDPRPGREVHVGHKRKDKMEYRDKYGYWPSDEEVKVLKDQKIRNELKPS